MSRVEIDDQAAVRLEHDVPDAERADSACPGRQLRTRVHGHGAGDLTAEICGTADDFRAGELRDRPAVAQRMARAGVDVQFVDAADAARDIAEDRAAGERHLVVAPAPSADGLTAARAIDHPASW